MKPLSLFLLAALLPAAAQPPRLTNAKLETRPATAGLEKEFRPLVNGLAGPAWVGYAVPIIAGEHQMCCWSDHRPCACGLERGTEPSQHVQSGAVKLESAAGLLVLFRVQQRAVEKIRTFSEDCQLDAGGLPFYWLTGVRPAESVALLSSFAAGGDRLSDSAVAAVAFHAGPEADRAFQQLVNPVRPEPLREKAVFWLGAARGKSGCELLRRILRDDPSQRIREKATFALSISNQPEAVDAMIDAARHDPDAHVRSQALFWLAQKAGKKAQAALTDAIANDPETDVKKRAVFALSQLPHDEGVPLLIQVARINRNPAVRKQAMFWLGQSKDPRALDFFEEVLKR